MFVHSLLFITESFSYFFRADTWWKNDELLGGEYFIASSASGEMVSFKYANRLREQI